MSHTFNLHLNLLVKISFSQATDHIILVSNNICVAVSNNVFQIASVSNLDILISIYVKLFTRRKIYKMPS